MIDHEAMARKLKALRVQRGYGAHEVMEAYRRYFSLPEFRTFFTGTVRGHGSEEYLRHVTSRFLRRLGQMAHSPVPVFGVFDQRPGTGDWHLHGLLAGVGYLTADHLREAWAVGRVDVEIPISEKARAYLADKIVNEGREWFLEPAQFGKAIRRVRYVAKRRSRSGMILYDAGGTPTNLPPEEVT